MVATTQLVPSALPGQGYGDFSGKAAAPPTGVVTTKVFAQGVEFEAGDEWYLTLAGPAIDNPRVRITIRYS